MINFSITIGFLALFTCCFMSGIVVLAHFLVVLCLTLSSLHLSVLFYVWHCRHCTFPCCFMSGIVVLAPFLCCSMSGIAVLAPFFVVYHFVGSLWQTVSVFIIFLVHFSRWMSKNNGLSFCEFKKNRRRRLSFRVYHFAGSVCQKKNRRGRLSFSWVIILQVHFVGFAAGRIHHFPG